MAVCPSSIALQSNAPASSRLASFVSTKTASTLRRPWLSVRSALGHSPVFAHTAAAAPALAASGLEPAVGVFGKQNSKFSDLLSTISSLYSEVGQERRAADEYMQRTAEESGRSTEDYERRALLFERSGEMVASSKLKGEKVMMELELLQGEVLECDEGRSAADYLRRAQIFSKGAEVFTSQVSDEALP